MARSDLFLDTLREAWASENWRRVRELALEWEAEHRTPFNRELVFPGDAEGLTVVTVIRRPVSLTAQTPLTVYSGLDYPLSWRLIDSAGNDISDGVAASWNTTNRESGLTLESNQTISGLKLFVHTLLGQRG